MSDARTGDERAAGRAAPIALPEHGTGERARRRAAGRAGRPAPEGRPADGGGRAGRGRRDGGAARGRRGAAGPRDGRRRLVGLVVAGVLLATGAVVLGGLGVLALTGDGGTPAAQPDAPSTTAPGTARGDGVQGAGTRGVALLVHRDAGGAVTGLTVARQDPAGAGGDVVFAPAGTMLEVPSFGLQPARDTLDLGGLPLLRASFENLLGVVVDAVVVLDPEALTRAVAPVAPLTVDVPAPVEEVDGTGRVEVLFPAGPQEVPAERLPTLLDTPGGETELDRALRHRAVWQAWLAAAGGEQGATSELGGDLAPLGRLVGALAAGEVAYHVLPVEVLSGALTADGEAYAVREAAVDALVDRAFPEALPASAAERVRVQVLNGTGEPGLAQAVTGRLVPAGAEVVVTANADRFDHETTQVVFYDPATEDAARRLLDALGVGELVRSRQRLDVVDVTVVVGADLLARIEAEGDAAPTTESAPPSESAPPAESANPSEDGSTEPDAG